MKFKKTIAILILLINSTVFADSGVLFYSSFDKGADAEISQSSKKAIASGQAAEFADGVKGKALLSGDTEGYVTYEVKDNINIKQGSIEFWFNPVNWDASHKTNHHALFEAAKPGWIMFYKYYVSDEAYFWLGEDQGTKRMITAADFKKLVPGEWYHVVLTWNIEEACVYMNGQMESCYKNPRLPSEVTGRFYVGDRPWLTTDPVSKFKDDVDTLIDELYIYNRALTAEEAKWAYENYKQRQGGEDVPQRFGKAINLKVVSWPSKKSFKVITQLDPRIDIEDAELSAVIKGEIESKPIVKVLDDHQQQMNLTYDKLQKGNYYVEVYIKKNGKTLHSYNSNTIFYPGEPEWLGNDIGKPTTPPSPWTPIEYQSKWFSKEHTVSCWGRKYVFKDSAFADEIYTQDKNILADDISLDAFVNGEKLKWKLSGYKLLDQNEVEVVSKSVLKSEIGILEVDRKFEFDGMIRYDITLKPKKDAQVNGLEMRFPLNPQLAELAHVSIGAYPRLTGKLSEEKGIIYKNSWMSYIWAGNVDLGFSAFCETDQAWDKIDREDGFYIERTGDSVDYVWSFIKGKTKLDSEWKFTFGIQATPVKNMYDYGDAIIHSVPKSTGTVRWPYPDLDKYYGFPGPVNPEEYKKMVAGYNDKGIRVSPYILLNYCSTAVPEWDFYGAEWASGGIWPSIGDVGVFNYPLGACLPIDSWIDFITWSNHKFVKEMNLDGLYHDFSWPNTCINIDKGFGYIRDGEERPLYSIFGTRELYKRTYTMLKENAKEKGVPSLMIAHSSSPMVIPIISFCDAYMAGEEYNSKLTAKGSYMAAITLDEFRTKYIGTNFGIRPMLLPNFRGEGRYKKGTGVQVGGLVLLHNTNLWGSYSWCNREEISQIMNKVMQWDIRNTEFIPYWKNQDFIKGQTEFIKCSAYKKEDGTMMLAVFNASAKNKNVAKLSIGSKGQYKVKEILSGKDVILEDGFIDVQLEPENLALYSLEEISGGSYSQWDY